MRKYRIKLSKKQRYLARSFMNTCRWTANKGIEVFNNTNSFSANRYRDQIITKTPRESSNTIIPSWLYDEYPRYIFTESPPSWVYDTPKVYRFNILRKLESNIKSAFSNLKNKNIKYFKFRFRSKKYRDVNLLQCDENDCSIVQRGDKVFLSMVGLGEMEIIIPKCDRRKRYIPSIVGGITIRYENNAWYADIQYHVQPTQLNDQKRICALDPGQRSFLSGFDLNGNSFQLGKDVQKQLLRLKLKRNLAQSEYDRLRKQSHRSYKQYRSFVRAKRSFYLMTNKIKNYVKELHYHCCKYLTDNYDKIIIPVYETQKMIKRGKSAFNDMILSLNHFRFRELLISKCQVLRKRVLVCTEEYTSVTCGNCNRQKMDLESQKIYRCSGCNYVADRDENAAYNILRYVINTALPIKSIY